MKQFITVFMLIFSVSVYASDYQESRSLKLFADGIEEIRIKAGAGFLKIEGADNLKDIEVEAEIILRDADADRARKYLSDRIELKLEQRGNTAVLISNFESNGFFGSGNNGLINLTIRLPRHIKLDIDDGSGSIDIRHIAERVKIEDGSGEIDVRNIGSHLYIDDGSGSISATGIRGNVEIEDGSGQINLEKVDDDVFVDDGSGSMDIREVGGNVVVKDGSGSITVRDVEQNLEIKEAGSGSVNIAGVKGNVTRKD